MKKTLILLGLVFLVSGCTNIKDSSYETLIEKTTNSRVNIYNTYRRGYKFYLPVNMYISNSKDYNETIKNESDTFYLYIDLISYLNGASGQYENTEEVYYFNKIENEDKNGYVEIKVSQDDKYLVEIAYNYAKIEVIVDESHIKKALTEGLIILSSIDYNDSFLKNLSNESLLNYKEETVDVFKKGSASDSTFLEYSDEFDSEDDNNLPDYDLIK